MQMIADPASEILCSNFAINWEKNILKPGQKCRQILCAGEAELAITPCLCSVSQSDNKSTLSWKNV